MKISMKAKSRNTGYTHKIADEQISAKNVTLEEDGQITVMLDFGPIHTTGKFKAKLSLSLSELHFVMGILEEKKLELLLRDKK